MTDYNFKLTVYENPDKDDFFDIIPSTNHPLNLKKPYKMAIIGSTGVGKSNLIKNIIQCTSPEFQIIYVWHIDEASNDYSQVPHIPFQITDNEDDFIEKFGGKYRKIPKLLIIDDVNLEGLKKNERANLYKLFTYSSTHCNLSIIVTVNDICYIGRRFRSIMSHLIVYDPLSDIIITTIVLRHVRRILNKHELEYVCKKYLKTRYDFIMFDFHKQAAYLNGCDLIVDRSVE